LLQSQRDTAYAGQCIMGFKYFWHIFLRKKCADRRTKK
jgi:hypothetical protein